MGIKPSTKSPKPEPKKPKPLSVKALFKKIDNYGTNIYLPIADELLAKSVDKDGFDILHTFTHDCAYVWKYISGGKPDEKQQAFLVERLDETEQKVREWDEREKYKKAHDETLELIQLLRTQLESFKTPPITR